MSTSAEKLQISHQCLECQQHHPEHRLRKDVSCDEENRAMKCPHCGSGQLEKLTDVGIAGPLPRFHANQSFERSVFTFAHGNGIDGAELDGIAQAVHRLAKHGSTVITNHQAHALSAASDLGYVTLANTHQGTVEIELLVPGTLLSSYFWSVWVPHFLQTRGYQTNVMPNLAPGQVVQYCSVAFRIPGSREAARLFLVDLAERFNDLSKAEIIHIEAGNAFERSFEGSPSAPRSGRS